MTGDELSLPFDGGDVEALSARWDEARGGARDAAVLLAHGAGFHLGSPFMQAVADGLASRGFDVLRFHYPYRERALAAGKRMLPVDPPDVLEAAHRVALAELERRADGRRLVLAGKSLGARFSTIVAAKDAPCHALVLLGYPLHPAGEPEKLRAEHFAAIVQPTLFFQGTRDGLCDLALLERERARFGGATTVEVIEGGDHSFHVPKRSGRTDEQVLDGMLARTASWFDETFPS